MQSQDRNNQVLIIRADAGLQIGTGHVMRCLALGQAWQDAGGRVIFITAAQNDGLIERLRQEGFDTRMPAQYYPDPADWKMTEKVLAEFPSAWIVLDGYHFDTDYHRKIKAARHRLLVIDDMAHLKHYDADIILNQNLYAAQLQYSCEPGTRMLSGTQYILLRREFRQWQKKPRIFPEVAQRVLVTMGGSDPQNVTLKVIQAFQQLQVTGLEAVIVIGVSNPRTAILEQAIKAGKGKFTIQRDVKNMPELMAWADVAVSSGGSTVWELAFMGVPMLVIPQAANQETIAGALQESRIALTYDYSRGEQGLITLQDILTEFLNNQKKRAEMSRLGGNIVDGLGAERVTASMKNKNIRIVENDGR